MTLGITINVNNVQIATIDDIPFIQGMNVQQAMEAAYDMQHAPAFGYSLRYYGSPLGYEVTELDGLSQQAGADANTYLFWELLINGAFSQHGIDSTFPADGDQIEWNYIYYAEERHSGTRYEKLRSAT
jgi:hypothetical protein